MGMKKSKGVAQDANEVAAQLDTNIGVAQDEIDEVLAMIAGDADGGTKVVEPEVIEEAPEDLDAALAELEADTTTAPTKKAKKTKAPAAPKQPAVAARAFTDVASIDAATLKTNLDACAAKKVNEKVSNVIQAIEHGKKLSRYTADAIRKLNRDGRVSGKSLVEEFLGLGLKDGTARAQAQQMTSIFKMLGIALPDASNPRELVLSDKVLVDELVAIAA